MSKTVDASGQVESGLSFSSKGHVRLRRVLPVIFCLLVGVVASLIVFVMQRSVTTSIETLAEVIMTRVSLRVVENTRQYLESAANAVRLNATILAQAPEVSAAAHHDFLEGFNQTTRKQLELYPSFGLIYQGDEQGNHWLNKREQDGTIHVRVIARKDDSPASKQILEEFSRHPKATPQDQQDIAAGIAPYIETKWYEQDETGHLRPGERDSTKIYDPRLRPWYQGAKNQNKLSWTDVYAWEERYKGIVSLQVGITASAPITRAGQLLGVAGIDISLQAVSEFLRGMEIMKNGRAFILNAKGETVGLANYQEVLEKVDESGSAVKLKHVRHVSDQAVAASYSVIRQALALTEQQPFELRVGRVVSFSVNQQHYYGFYKPFTSDFGLDWTVGMVIPEDDFLGDVKQEVRHSLVIVVASIGMMILVGIWIGRMIAKPLRNLSEEVERIIKFDLAPTPPLKTRFLELGRISFAFARMKLALAGMIDDIFAHTKTLDWSAEEFANVALTLEDSTHTMGDSIQTARTVLQGMAEQPHTQEVLAAITQMEHSLNELRNLSQPVTQRAQNMTNIAQALRKALQTFRI